MPNPRYLSKEGEPTPELLEKLVIAKSAYMGNLEWFCNRWGARREDLENITGVYLIGSHAKESGWMDDTSDLDLKLVTPDADGMTLMNFRNEVLRQLLCRGRKKDWIDIFFVHDEYQVTKPRYELTEHWRKL